MPDYFTTVTASEELRASEDQVRPLFEGLGLTPGAELPKSKRGDFFTITHDPSAYTIEWDPKSSELYIFAEDYACTGEVPEEFWVALAKLLKAKKKPYLEFGWASHCSKPCAGSFGGGEFRLYQDGYLKHARCVHPRHKIRNA